MSTSLPSQRAQTHLRARWAAIVLAVICLLWAGMVFGNGFNAGVRFTRPSLHVAGGRAVIFDVGRTVFSAFNKVEIFWSVLTFALFFFARPWHRAPQAIRVLLPLVWVIIVFQSVYLLPALIERALIVMRGETLPPAPVHALYTSSEFLKLISLISIGVSAIKHADEK